MKQGIFMALLLIFHSAFGETTVSGEQTGTWTAEGSPYLVVGDIFIPVAQSLTIEPGVEVNFQGYYQFTVNGYLQAVGTEADSIYFTTDDHDTGWGGIRVDSDDICDLSYCRIEFGRSSAGEYPDIHGGGMALLTSNAIVSNCVFADNDATGSSNGMGGAVYAINTGDIDETMTRFSDCVFIRNHAYGEGGAIKFTSDFHTEITNCRFIENDCGYGGGAIHCYSVVGTKMTNCLFADNYTMYSSGGAVGTLGSSNILYFANCTLSGNSAVTGDGGAVNLAFANAYIVNTIVYDNPGMYSDDINLDFGGYADIYYSDLTMPSGATGTNNIEEDPLFVNPANFDFTLQETSPCIDAGIAFFMFGADTLIDLSPDQYSGSAPDMGAFEYGMTGIEIDTEDSNAGLRLLQSYPNPFSTNTFVIYRIPTDTHVTLSVYDLLGREVRTIIDSTQPPGIYSVIWDGRNNTGQSTATGTYLIRLRAGEESCSKMVMYLN